MNSYQIECVRQSLDFVVQSRSAESMLILVFFFFVDSIFFLSLYFCGFVQLNLNKRRHWIATGAGHMKRERQTWVEREIRHGAVGILQDTGQNTFRPSPHQLGVSLLP